MRGEKMMAIFIGLIMVFSMVGFAATSIFTDTGGGQTIEIPSVMKSKISKENKLYVLRTGKVLIEHYYPSGCSECLSMNSMLEIFAKQFSGYVVVAEAAVPANETLFQAIGSAGRIRDMEYNMTQEGLMDIFCEITFRMPKECLLSDIFPGEEQDVIPQSPADYY